MFFHSIRLRFGYVGVNYDPVVRTVDAVKTEPAVITMIREDEARPRQGRRIKSELAVDGTGLF